MKTSSIIAKTTYGKRKLDPEAYAAQQAKQKRTTKAGIVFGKRKAGPSPAAVAPKPAPVEPDVQEQEQPSRNPFIPEGDDDASGYVTVKELEAKLAEDAGLLEDAFAAEFRDGAPRKGAIAVMLKVAKSLPQGDERLKRMIQVLEGHA